MSIWQGYFLGEHDETLLSLPAGDSEYAWEDLDRKGGDFEAESRRRCPRNVAGFARSAAVAIRPPGP